MTVESADSLAQRARLAAVLIAARTPLVVKLTVPILVVGALVAIILGVALYRTEAGRIRDNFENRALLLTQSLEAAVAQQATGEDDEELARTLQNHIDFLAEGNSEILRINAYALQKGTPAIIASSSRDQTTVDGAPVEDEADIQEDLEAIYATSAHVDEEELDGQSALEVSLPVRIDGEPALAVGAYFSTADRDGDLAALLQTVILGAGVSLLGVSVLVFLLYRLLILSHLRRLVAATGRMQEGDYSARVAGTLPADARDDLVRLSVRFNSMAEAIESLQGRLSEQATTDELTGLHNRRYVLDSLEREIARARRSGQPMAAIMVDLDGLKTVNDRSGHPAGDKVLRQVAHAIRSNVRASDVAARFGGDEFVVVLPDCDGECLGSLLERIRAGAEHTDPAQLGDGVTVPATISAGGAVLRTEDDLDTLLQRADDALLEAKRAGRNRVRVAA